MYVTAWSSGQPAPPGAGYGVRISEYDRDQHFDRNWPEVLLDLGGGKLAVVPLSTSFWGRCRELRSAAIGRWLFSRQLGPRCRGGPPSLVLQHIAENRFERYQSQWSARGGER